ncbi:MAG TPA: FAD-dependent oxidoreductase, partial [Anaerovoracaceae bacterium]|nr:FAD-dependent oxidoreductase [Anaerovoracaceae bacterium]
MKQFDVLIIGAGAVGNAIAREISKLNRVTVGLLEKEPDTAFGISGRNSGVLHAGFNNRPGSLMAKLCVQGSEGFEREAAELNLPFKKTGKLIIARYEEDLERLQKLKEQGETNGVRELRIVGREELTELAGYE